MDKCQWHFTFVLVSRGSSYLRFLFNIFFGSYHGLGSKCVTQFGPEIASYSRKISEIMKSREHRTFAQSQSCRNTKHTFFECNCVKKRTTTPTPTTTRRRTTMATRSFFALFAKKRKLCSLALSLSSFVYRLARRESVCVCVCYHILHLFCEGVCVSGGSDNNLEQYRTKRNRNYVKLQIADTSSVQSISKQFVDLPKKKMESELLLFGIEIGRRGSLTRKSTNFGVKVLRKNISQMIK